MQTDLTYHGRPERAADEARAAQEAGIDGFKVTETRHDAFVQLALAASATDRIQLGTAVAIGFARNPMSLAILGYDLQRLSGGRMVLGLGSQIRPHITRRYSMPWSAPAARMREMVLAVRAIWESWQTGTPLRFRGEFYTHTLMTPVFDPGPLECGSPRVVLAAVGPAMVGVAAEVADGMICHPLNTPEHLRAAILPGIVAARGGRSGFEVAGQVLVATGHTEEQVVTAVRATRKQLAFYASTPAYLPVLERHGLAELHEELHGLSRRGEWERMADRIDDDVLALFAVVGDPAAVGREIVRRYDGLLDRVSVSLPGSEEGALVRDVLRHVVLS